MKRIVVIVLTLVVGGGFLAARSFVSAADKAEPVQSFKTQADLDNESAWEAWRVDFAARLDEDQKYIAAEEAVLDVPIGDEYDEAFAEAEAVRDARYREIGRALYEQHFGAWAGDDAEFDDLLADRVADSPAMRCAKAATYSCGRGRVCSWTLSDGGGCTVTCQDGQGECSHATGS